MQAFKSVITPEQTNELLNSSNLIIIDCRYELSTPDKGKEDFQHSHIPGAIYAHLKYDLAGPVVPERTGRHPLPDIDELSKKFSSWGIGKDTQVIAYDESTGAMVAARVWWLLKYLGHDNVAVLNGGFENWTKQGYPTTAEIITPKPAIFTPEVNPQMLVTSNDVEAVLNNNNYLIIDSRAEERYLGEFEPIDPIAGRIPGAVNRFHANNNDDDGKYKNSSLLKEEFTELINNIPADKTIFYCGSGVTGAQNVLAYYYAGLGLPKLYAGSWSEWITDPNRPILGKEKE